MADATDDKKVEEQPTEQAEAAAEEQPAEIDVVPEGETLLWTSARAKLYRFAKDGETGEWKERGVGCVYLLKYNDNGKVHAVMRREKTHKVCMNHMVFSDIEMRPNSGSDKSWVWSAADFADEEVKTEVFAIRFKKKEESQEFNEMYKTHGTVPESSNESEPKKEEKSEAKADGDEDAKEGDGKKEEAEASAE